MVGTCIRKIRHFYFLRYSGPTSSDNNKRNPMDMKTTATSTQYTCIGCLLLKGVLVTLEGFCDN